MNAAQLQSVEASDREAVVLASSDRAWCDQVEAALLDASGYGTTVVLRLTDPPEVGLPPEHDCEALWLVDEAWLAPLLARHTGMREPFCALKLMVRVEHSCSERIVQAMEAGARGCLDGDADIDEVLRAIEAVREGELWLSRKLFARILGHFQQVGLTPHLDDCGARLTDRQRQVAACVAEGMSNKQIGRRLGISPTTVKTHLHNIFERVGVGGRTLLALRAMDGDGH